MINILIVLFEKWNKKRYIMCYFPLTYDDRLILVMLIIKMSCIIVFIKMIVSVFSSNILSH